LQPHGPPHRVLNKYEASIDVSIKSSSADSITYY
jgi:hypothetical protein